MLIKRSVNIGEKQIQLLATPGLVQKAEENLGKNKFFARVDKQNFLNSIFKIRNVDAWKRH